MWIAVRRIFRLAAPSAAASILSKAGASNSRPFDTTALILCVLRMSSNGFASSKTRSAIFPCSIVPRVLSKPKGNQFWVRPAILAILFASKVGAADE